MRLLERKAPKLTLRELQIWELRESGLTYTEIKNELGYKSEGGVTHSYENARAKLSLIKIKDEKRKIGYTSLYSARHDKQKLIG